MRDIERAAPSIAARCDDRSSCGTASVLEAHVAWAGDVISTALAATTLVLAEHAVRSIAARHDEYGASVAEWRDEYGSCCGSTHVTEPSYATNRAQLIASPSVTSRRGECSSGHRACSSDAIDMLILYARLGAPSPRVSVMPWTAMVKHAGQMTDLRASR